jgi:hypothetical protein
MSHTRSWWPAQLHGEIPRAYAAFVDCRHTNCSVFDFGSPFTTSDPLIVSSRMSWPASSLYAQLRRETSRYHGPRELPIRSLSWNCHARKSVTPLRLDIGDPISRWKTRRDLEEQRPLPGSHIVNPISLSCDLILATFISSCIFLAARCWKVLKYISLDTLPPTTSLDLLALCREFGRHGRSHGEKAPKMIPMPVAVEAPFIFQFIAGPSYFKRHFKGNCN